MTTYFAPHTKCRVRPTKKQVEILAVIANLQEEGEVIHMRRIVDSVSYVTSQASMVFSIKALLSHEWIVEKPYTGAEKRWKKCFEITEAGRFALSLATPAGESFVTAFTE